MEGSYSDCRKHTRRRWTTWRDGELLVTGHDDRVGFRLRIVEGESVLKLVGTETIPFTGQGIAHDPKTGGLVGIDRGKKLIVFAVAKEAMPQRLRLLSYNIHHGEGTDGKLDLERIARVIKSGRPDLVALQEVDRNTERTRLVDQPAELARLTEMKVAYGPNIEFQGGEYGNVVLSRYLIRRHENHKLPRFDDGEQRGVLVTEIDVPGSDTPLLFLATHLDHRAKDAERLASAKAIAEIAAKHADRPMLLAGDLNDVADSAVLRQFEKHWTRTNEKELPTIPVTKPTRQIDFILFRPRERWKAIETMVLDEAVASDHRAIFAVVEMTPPTPK